MAKASVFLVSVTRSNGGETEFKAILEPMEESIIRNQLKNQYEAGAIADYGVFQQDSTEYLSYESAMRRLAPSGLRS